MKLHLPKLLCVAAMALPAMGAELTSTTYTDEYGQEHTKWDVGHAVVGESKPYDNPTKYLDGKTDLILDGKDTLGVYKDGVFYEDDFTTIRGQAPSRTGTYTYKIDKPDLCVTNDFHIDGTLTLKDDSKVNLGGQFRKEYLKSATATSYSGNYDEYIGLKATKVIVQDNASLYSTRARIGTLQIDGGDVKLKNGWTSGSTSAYADGDKGDSKQTQILEKLDLNGGTLSIGTTGANAKHWHQVFGGVIEQDTGSTMYVYGNSIWKSGITITQEGGTMNFCDTVGKISLDGAATIKQTGTGTMNFGELYSTSARTVGIEQSGNGTLNLKKGVTYTSTTASTITQSGGGKINLSGDFSNAVFDITQSKGTINVNNGATMNSTKLALDTDALLNIDGELTLNEGGTFKITVNSAHDAAINIGDTGSLVATAQALSLSLHEAVVNDMMETVESATKSGLLTYTIDLISATKEGTLNDLKGDLTWKWEGLPQTATLAADTTATVTSYEYIGSDLVVNKMDDGYMLQAAITWNVTAAEQVPEPTTATLSLLALAGLAARRRRR